MMQTLAICVTAAAMLIHALVGCCLHHTHLESTCEAAGESSIEPVVHGSHVHWPGDEPTSGGHDHEHDGDPGCDGDRCTYVRSDVRATQLSPIDAATLATPLAPATLSSTLWLRLSSPLKLGHVPLHVPLHLLHCVLTV
jgi:hypothetical protein